MNKPLDQHKLPDPLLKIMQAAKIVDCAPSTVYSWIEGGLLPAVKIQNPNAKGKRSKTLVRVKLSDVLEMIERHYQRA